MMDELLAWANGRLMGRVWYDRRRDRLGFDYDTGWREDEQAFPLSLSMPHASASHGHDVVFPFLWGLLPDNDGVLQRWGARFNVSPRNPFKLLSHVGEDCAGAVQLVKPERLETWRNAARKGRITWLTDDQIGDRMKLLLQDHSASRTSTDQGRFSLAGAQPKTAFHFDPKAGRWGVPSGMTPTTHIFKPATGAYDGYAENEHFCIVLARVLGMAVAESSVRYFGDIPVIVLERYDRRRVGKSVSRVHQEDMCQALARMPQQKYQNQGGPSAVEIMALIRQFSSARETDAARFLDALLLNWFIAGTDAHAKNYSFLIGGGGAARLAPLYDLSSALPYPAQVNPRHATLAMRVGNQYKLQRIGAREWRKCAAELRMDDSFVKDRMTEIAKQLPDAVITARRELKNQGIRHSVITRLVKELRERVKAARSLW